MGPEGRDVGVQQVRLTLEDPLVRDQQVGLVPEDNLVLFQLVEGFCVERLKIERESRLEG